MNYKSVVISRRGTPDVLQVVETKLRPPHAGEVCIKVLATGVGRTDVAMRRGYYPFAPKIPFTPGYEIIGVVESIGDGVDQVAVDDRVAALTVYGGYAEYIYLYPEELVPVPALLNPATAVALILNYVTAYQMLHRTANVKSGDKVLITGASGGVGTALLQLGKLAGLNMYATAAKQNHDLLLQHGATPIDYKTEDFVAVIHRQEADGLDFVFDGLGGRTIQQGFKVLRRGGKLIEYGYPSFGGMLTGLARLTLGHWLPNGKSAAFYGITGLYRQDKRPFLTDLPILFDWLAQGQISPIIAHTLPLLEAAKANEWLENGHVRGKIVLLAPELLAARG